MGSPVSSDSLSREALGILFPPRPAPCHVFKTMSINNLSNRFFRIIKPKVRSNPSKVSFSVVQQIFVSECEAQLGISIGVPGGDPMSKLWKKGFSEMPESFSHR